MGFPLSFFKTNLPLDHYLLIHYYIVFKLVVQVSNCILCSHKNISSKFAMNKQVSKQGNITRVFFVT